MLRASLLIALHDLNSQATPERVLRDFIEHELQRSALDSVSPASDFRIAINELAEGMMSFRNLRPRWREIESWDLISGKSRELLAIVGRRGFLFRLIGHSAEQRIEFRHDRVRESLLVECCLALDKDCW